jgi:hypothetical protein
MTDLATNVLYYGDNLDIILRRYLPDAAVDPVYPDPPFNSNRDDNVIFRDESGNATDAQLAFKDIWHWAPSAEATYAYLTNTARHEGRVPDKVSTFNEGISAIGQLDTRGRWEAKASLNDLSAAEPEEFE